MSEQPKKCFCARCFLPIEPEDKVDIEGQNFHRMCSMCCICRQVPTSIKMFYGHVFCNECFKTHVLNRYKGDQPRMHSNSWWMQWAPGMLPQMQMQMQVQQQMGAQAPQQEQQPQAEAESPEVKEECEKIEEEKPEKDSEEQAEPTCAPPPEEAPKKCICARCLQAVDESIKVDIGGQSFHPQCCRCCFCHTIPKDNVKIYYGQVFCEDCFNRFVLSRNKDTPAENLKACFEQWQNSQFAENMREFMSGKQQASPMIFMMQQGAHPPTCRCGCGAQPQGRDWFPANEPRKSATPATLSIGEESFGTWDLSFENRDEVSLHESRSRESANQENLIVAAAEKIEKLTKYLQDNSISEKPAKKWKNFIEYDKSSMASEMEPLNPLSPNFGWVDLQDPKVRKNDVGCPKCLWQCGSIFVNSEYFQKEVMCCGENLF